MRPVQHQGAPLVRGSLCASVVWDSHTVPNNDPDNNILDDNDSDNNVPDVNDPVLDSKAVDRLSAALNDHPRAIRWEAAVPLQTIRSRRGMASQKTNLS